MMYGIIFALLGLCLACFRDGVWTKYTPQDVARWQAEQARTAPTPACPATLSPPGPATPSVLRSPATPPPRPSPRVAA